MSILSPAWRSAKAGQLALGTRQIVGIGAITLILPPMVGVMGLLIGRMFGQDMPAGDVSPAVDVALAFSALLAVSIFYGIVLVPAGLLIGALAMRVGFAGWIVAIGLSLVLPLGLGGLVRLSDPTSSAFGIMSIISPISGFYGLTMWVATRLICPRALLGGAPVTLR